MEKNARRDFLKATVMSAACAGAVLSREEQILLAAVEQGADKPKAKPSIDPKSMPTGKIGNVTMSRLWMGGNLIGGWAHSRDLLYVSRLFKAYNTEAKIFETLDLAEQCGINTIQIDPRAWEAVQKHNKERGGKMQTVVCMLPEGDKKQINEHVKKLVDQGANLLYVHGGMADALFGAGKLETLAISLEAIKAQGIPAGMGSHSLQVPMTCEEKKLGADFYVKTFHMDEYWSATPKDGREDLAWNNGDSPDHNKYHDNMWCLNWEETAKFMATIEKPWIAFKVMAAGAIHPSRAFSHAFRHGADFVMAGMFDFQVEQDAQLAITAVRNHRNRERPWRA